MTDVFKTGERATLDIRTGDQVIRGEVDTLLLCTIVGDGEPVSDGTAVSLVIGTEENLHAAATQLIELLMEHGLFHDAFMCATRKGHRHG